MKAFVSGLWIAAAVLLFSDTVFLSRGWAASDADNSSSTLLQGSKKGRLADDYLLQPGDRVNIKIYPEDAYLKGGEIDISSEGNITLPLAGRINVAGKKVAEAERKIADILDADYLVNPEVVVEVLEYKKQSFVVLGQVKKPGTYQFSAGSTHMTLLQAVSMAGGFSDIANVKKIKIIRGEGDKKKVIDADAEAMINGSESDIDLEAGDVIHVSESLF